MIDESDDEYPEEEFSLEYIKFLFKASDQEKTEQLSLDKEWTDKHFIHMTDIISAFAVGVLQSDIYFRNYQFPPNFEKVMNIMCKKLQKEFDNEEIIEVGLLKIRGVYKRLAFQIPEYLEWNKFQGKREYIDENIYELIERDFIDLDVPPHNAAIHLRNLIRERKRFERRFRNL